MKYLFCYLKKPSRRQVDLAATLKDAGHIVEFRKVEPRLTGNTMESIIYDEILDSDRERFNALLASDLGTETASDLTPDKAHKTPI